MIIRFTDISLPSSLLQTGNPIDQMLYYVIDDFDKFANKPNGKFQAQEAPKDEYRFLVKDDYLIPTGQFIQLISHQNVEVEKPNIHIYAPIALLDENVPDWLYDHEQEVEGEMVPVTFREWGASGTQQQPIRENDTHCIIRTEVNNKFPDKSQILQLISWCDTNGYEFMLPEAMKAKLVEFEEEEP